MKRPEVDFSRTATTDCKTGEVTEDTVTARMGKTVLAKMKSETRERLRNGVNGKWAPEKSWHVEWTAHSVLQVDIEQVLAKLVELNESERTPNAGK